MSACEIRKIINLLEDIDPNHLNFDKIRNNLKFLIKGILLGIDDSDISFAAYNTDKLSVTMTITLNFKSVDAIYKQCYPHSGSTMVSDKFRQLHARLVSQLKSNVHTTVDSKKFGIELDEKLSSVAVDRNRQLCLTSITVKSLQDIEKLSTAEHTARKTVISVNHLG